jgi:hypothetical protein
VRYAALFCFRTGCGLHCQTISHEPETGSCFISGVIYYILGPALALYNHLQHDFFFGLHRGVRDLRVRRTCVPSSWDAPGTLLVSQTVESAISSIQVDGHHDKHSILLFIKLRLSEAFKLRQAISENTVPT